ncbi:GntR family transcriptional regulator [Rubellimicrobium aerolatum]|uniref:GntR family transcriptional regulator n=1 Tax=Rubellimicrobium aerolatum TaxID=490979 RepID=A0ABW0S5Q9_9RHOB|nr:GntR family transcriptional regulator [Rubellimicrobium aerolatum]MBP1804601.1 DNA-binding GntR family transcriptional regulator [Rubellimicrobium aerolatum]
MSQAVLESPIQADPPSLRPLDAFAGSLSQRVHASLKEAILDLTLRPGAILRKGEVCAALGVSRSPVAEAVARLAQEALVDVVPQAGTYVARLSMEEVREGAFLREALEIAAVEMVAGRVGAEQLAQLRRNLRLQEAALVDGDIGGFHAADALFHELILSFTGHRRLPGLSRTAWVHVDRARRLLLPTPGRVDETLEEHRAILAALEARDPEAARAATRAHLRQLVTRLERLVVERPELFAGNLGLPGS